MNLEYLLAALFQTNRLKKQLDKSDIKDSKERMLWWYDNRKKIRLRPDKHID